MTDITSLAGELRRHDDDIRDIRKQQDTIVSEIKTISTAVTNVASSLTEMRAQKGPPWHQLIGTASQVVLVAGGLITGVVYIATTGQSQQQHVLDKRVSGLEWRLDRTEGEVMRHRSWVDKTEGIIKRLEFAAGWKQSVQRD